MLRTDKLLNAINLRVVNWKFSNCYETEKLAKKECAKLFTNDKILGTTIRAIGHGKYATFYWSKEKDYEIY